MSEAEMSDWEIIAATILIYLRIPVHVWSWDVWLRDYSSRRSHLPENPGTCLKLRCLTERLTWVSRHMFEAEMSDWETYLSIQAHVWNWDVWLRDLPEYPGTYLKVRCLTERLTWVSRHMFEGEMSDWETYLSIPAHVWSLDVWLRDLPEYPGTCLKLRCLTERLTWVSRHMFEGEMSDWETYLSIPAHVWRWDVWLRDLPEYPGTCLKVRGLTERFTWVPQHMFEAEMSDWETYLSIPAHVWR